MSAEIIIGDCRKVLPTLPPGSVDCCITDPPYGDTSLKWDVQCHGWVEALVPVLKPNASVWVFGSLRFMVPLYAEMEKHGFKYAQDIVWEKQNGTGAHNDRFRRVHEHVVQFYLGKWAEVYKLPQYTMDAVPKTVRRTHKPEHWGAIEGHTYTSEDGGPRLARSVQRHRNEHGRAIHPTQKPVELLVTLVRYSCPPPGTLIDCFSGSGSLGVAANVVGVNSILIEKDPVHAGNSLARLRNDAPLLAALP